LQSRSQVDHLNTPRQVYDVNQQLRWKWDQSEAFGNNLPDENPSSLGVFAFDLGMPGQVRDRETGLFYNYFRDCYDSVLGRYCESDPIGLSGGATTYAYVDGNPLTFRDPAGLYKRPGIAIPGLETSRLGLIRWLLPIGRGLGRVALLVVPEPLANGDFIDPEVMGRIKIFPTSEVEELCAKPDGRDPCKGLRDALRDHLHKLKNYLSNPYDPLNDNLGLLRDNPASRHRNIISGRLTNLLNQVENFRKQLEECEQQHGMR